jgi:predicted ferric reductase
MLQYVSEESVLHSGSRVVFHYLIRSREEALFLEIIGKVNAYFGGLFEAHLWITRQESGESQGFIPQSMSVHRQVASLPSEIGESWHWWKPFVDIALEPFNGRESKRESLVYICGPQGLTDKLVSLYAEHDMHIEDGHVQIEKWW